MSDWRQNSSGYWSNQGSGHAPQYPNTIDEEELEGEQSYSDIGEGYTYESPQGYEHQEDEQHYQQQGYWTDEPQSYQPQGQAAYTSDDQQLSQNQGYYQPTDADQGEVTYTPYTGSMDTYTGSMDVNFSEHGQDTSHQESTPPPPPLDADPATGDDRTQDFVAQRQGSYDRREEFHNAPDTALMRRVVDTRQRIRDADARARARARGRERGSGGSGSNGRGGGSGSGSGSGNGGRGSGSGSGGKSSGSKGSSKSGGRS